ncbi:hypothetical protein [Maridesulfovibrio ferrireducens]|uniref:hypothetical protein n=1 Tax=Maridesulfovibrio ferrireducens TaxID=246191 RepID=UPI001A32C4F4|nr:hypothetical protein [Maridesulfovibrio ferrireducens]MBI9110305.1 hypothetical protein [Maridesulfovibrio ferrireducens]
MNSHRIWEEIILQVADEGEQVIVETPMKRRIAIISAKDLELLERIKTTVDQERQTSEPITYSYSPGEMTQEEKIQAVYKNAL